MNNYVDDSLAKIDNRLIYADILRIVAILAIVMVHLGSGALYWAKPTETTWINSLIYDTLFNWGSVVFVIMSGLFMLKPKRIENLGIFYKRRITRILVPFIIWALIYQYVSQAYSDETFTINFFTNSLKNLITGNVKVHLWFVYMIFAMYLITPILSIFVNNASKQQLKYYFIYWIVSMTLNSILIHFFHFGNAFQPYIELNNYAGFYLLGYAVEKYNFRINNKYFLLIPAFMLLKFFLVKETSMEAGQTLHFFRDRLQFNIILIPILIFFAFRQINWTKTFPRKSNRYKILVKYSALSYGIFLSHMLIIDLFQNAYFGLKITPYWAFGKWLPIWFGTPFFAGIVFISILILVNILNKIPYINKLTL